MGEVGGRMGGWGRGEREDEMDRGTERQRSRGADLKRERGRDSGR